MLDIFFSDFKRWITIKKFSIYETSSNLWVSFPQDSQTLEIYPTNLPSFPVQLTCGVRTLWITRCLGIQLVHKLTPSYSQFQLFRKSFPRLTQKILVFILKTPIQVKKYSFHRCDKNMSQKCRILGYTYLYPEIGHIEMGPKSWRKASQMCVTSLAQGGSHYNMVINSWSGLVWESLHRGTVLIWFIPPRNATGHVKASKHSREL